MVPSPQENYLALNWTLLKQDILEVMGKVHDWYVAKVKEFEKNKNLGRGTMTIRVDGQESKECN